MAKKYDEKTKKACIAARLEGRTVKSINAEYGLGIGTLKNWMTEYYENAPKSTIKEDAQLAELKKELAEMKKENDFLKKATSYFASQQKN
jgi:transposase